MSLSREEIIRMAREAGFPLNETSSRQFQNRITEIAYAAYAAGAAAEREQCSMVCDRFQWRGVGMQPAECAAAIRARGNGGEK